MFAWLPIVQRELRVAARRRSLFRARWWTAFLALGLSLVSFGFVSLGPSGNAGRQLFGIFTGYAFGLSLLAGVLLTADTLAAEKRDGTLGLLFLTDLKGYDIVLGKLAACSLTSFYCLLALLPVTALPLLAGGVTGGDFSRTALALVNALFFALATGLCVSAFMRDSQRAMGNALGLLFLIVAAVPVLVHLTRQTRWAEATEVLSWFSPFTPFNNAAAPALAGQARGFWRAMAASQALAWALLGLASFGLPRQWQEGGSSQGRRPFWLGSSNRVRRQRLRQELLPAHPVAWLAACDLGIQSGVWGIVLGWGVLVIGTVVWWPMLESELLAGYLMGLFGFGLKLLFALQAGRFFIEARRNGTLELMLCTPLQSRDIVAGQVRALRRAFFWPVAVFIALSLSLSVSTFISQTVAGELTHALNNAAGALFLSGINSVRMIVDLLAVCWFGMGLALTMKRPALAPALTILFVLVLPAFLCWLDIIPSLILMAVGLSRCQRDLRRQFSEQYRP